MPDNQSLFIISDLHLGGDGDFQMCPPKGRSRLSDFIDYITSVHRSGVNVHLVLNGDIVDFLAEKEFTSFTNDDRTASDKLRNIIRGSKAVWEGLAELVESGARLTIMLGNHDVELSLPGPRRLLLDTVGGDRVSFIYDNEALVVGPVLIEHGNRYDDWNTVSHGAMRAIRSAMSRREEPIEYYGPAGSQLVAKVMNPLKERYPFVDLLKPETSGVLPILAVLEPSEMKQALRLSKLAAKAKSVAFDENGLPRDQQNIAAAGAGQSCKDEMLDLALSLSGLDDPQNISLVGDIKDFWGRLKDAATERARQIQLDMLLSALRAYTDHHRQAFDVGREEEEYLRAANEAARNGFKVVVFGHTHLVKRVDLDAADSLYLNTGTWADLMKVPEAIFGDDEEKARRQLEAFLDDLKHRRLDAWRCQLPTFARIDLNGNELIDANVYFYDGGGNTRSVPGGRLSALNYAIGP